MKKALAAGITGLLICVGTSFGAQTAVAGGFKNCGKVSGQRGSSTVKQKNFNCAGARRVIRIKLSVTGDPLGWKCRGSLTEVTCRQGRKVVKGRVV